MKGMGKEQKHNRIAGNSRMPNRHRVIREDADRLRTLFESMPDAAVIVDADLNVIDANPAAARLAGFHHTEDFIGTKGLDFIPREQISEITASLNKAVEGEFRDRVQMSIVNATGRHVDVEISVSILTDDAGKIKGFIVIGHDITQRRLAEQSLQDSESRFRELFENMSSGVAVYEATGTGEDFIFKDLNSAGEKISRMRKQDIIGRSVRSVRPGLSEMGFIDVLRRVWLTGKPERLPTAYYQDEHLSGWRDNYIYKLPSGEVVAIYDDVTERMEAQEALRESEEKLRIIFESMKDAVTITDMTGMIIDVNEAALRIGNFDSKADIIGHNGFDYVAEKDRSRAQRNMERSFQSGSTATVEYTFLRKDGTEYTAESSASILRDRSGKPAGTLSVSRDVTERKRIQQALEESEARYRSVIENANEAIVVAQDGMLKFFNPKTLEIMCYSREELESRSFLDVIHPEDREMVAERHIRRLMGEEMPHVYAFRIIDKDGNVKWVEINAVLIEWDGRPATLNFLNDITARREAEEALREGEEKLRLMFESIGEMLMILDLHGNMVDVNPSLVRTMGYSRREELLGRSAADLVVESERKNVINYTIESIKHREVTGKSDYRHLKLKTADGSLLDAEYSITLMHDRNGRLTGVIGIGRDITQRLRAENELRRRNRELSAIASVTQMLSQQLRLNRVLHTALNSILDVVNLSAGAVWLVDAEGETLELANHRGFGEQFAQAVTTMPVKSGITSRAFRTGKTVAVSNIAAQRNLSLRYKDAASAEGLRSFISIPLKTKARTLGAMCAFSHERLDLPPEELRLLDTLAGQICIAIENAQLLEKLSELSETDALTGLYNRRTFYAMLETEISHSGKLGHPFSLVMLDLDGFKTYNDRFGHTAGDAALKSFAAALKSALRKSDVAFRYGGDEFTLILPGTESLKARSIIDRIRSRWTQTPYAHYSGAETPIRFSAGIAQYPDDTESLDGLIFLADTALFLAKREGGYQSMTASEVGTLPSDVLGTATLEQVFALASMVDSRSPYLDGHSKRVAIIAGAVGNALGLDEELLSQLHTAALLHDIGKIGIPDTILGKPDSLTKDEKHVIDKHPAEGARILSHVMDLSAILPYVKHHHEWYDGSGYPDKLKGEEIPLLARILTVADSYDTMTTPLPHKKAMSHNEAVEELKRYSGMQFDPDVVEAFRRSVNRNIAKD